MKSKRLTWSLVAACVVSIAALIAAWLVPYFRERAALAEFARHGVGAESSERLANRMWPSDSIGLEPGEPEWLRSLVGDERMRPFDRVTKVDLYSSPKTSEP